MEEVAKVTKAHILGRRREGVKEELEGGKEEGQERTHKLNL